MRNPGEDKSPLSDAAMLDAFAGMVGTQPGESTTAGHDATAVGVSNINNARSNGSSVTTEGINRSSFGTGSGDWIDGEHQGYQPSGLGSPLFGRGSPTPNVGEDILGYASRAFLAAGAESSSPTKQYESVSMSSYMDNGSNRPLASSMIHEEHTVFGSKEGNIPIHCGQNVQYSGSTTTTTTTAEQFTSQSTESQHQTGYPLVPTSGKVVDCCKYELNKDPTPEIIVKHPDKSVVYKQDIGIRYLKPPTPPPSGDIVIREVRPPPIPEAPPLYVRLNPQRPKTPPPLIIREAPPLPPKPLPMVCIDKVLPPAPPPPRKVIVERLPPLPPKPQKVIIEKWLPYDKIKRNIIYQRAPDLPEPKKFHNLGVVRADPAAYASQHSHEMSDSTSTMNAIASMGARLHYNEAAGAQTSGQTVYYEDRDEIDRLMKTNFHPTDPVCKQFVERFGESTAYSGVRPAQPPDGRSVCEEANNMARMYSEVAFLNRSGMGCADSGSFFSQGDSGPCAAPDLNWLGSSYGQMAPPQMVSMQCQDEVLGMYPQFCHDSHFLPMFPCPQQPMDACPFAINDNHSAETCTMCQQLLMPHPHI